MLRWKTRILYNQAGDGGAGGGGAAGAAGNPGAAGGNPAGGADPLFGDGGNQNGGGAAGGNPGGDGAAAQPGAGAGANPGGQGGSVTIPQNWKEALPPELKDAPFLKNVADIPTLVKNYENAQKMVGADKIAIPQKGAGKEEWQAVFRKLGVPEKPEDYKFELDAKSKVEPEFLKGFTRKAHELGVLPEQAKQMMDWFSAEDEKVYQQMQTQAQAKMNEGINALKTEWGQAFDQKIAGAKAALKEYASEEQIKYFREAGFGRDPQFLRFLDSVSKTLAEDTLKGGGEGAGGTFMTPQQAQAKIDQIKRTPSHPYWDPNHAGHQDAKKEFNLLFQYAFPKRQEEQT
jgi:hypothetical protein